MIRRNVFFASVVLVLAVLIVPALAGADPIGFVGPTDFTGTGHGASVSATLTSGGVSHTAGWAGEINWAWGDGNPATPDVVPDSFAKDFFSYCIDITSYLTDPQTVQVTSSSGFTNGVAYGGEKAAWLFNTYADDLRDNKFGLSATELNNRAAALQIAIWEAMYDSTGDLSGGLFTLATTGLIRTYADQYVSSLYSAGLSAWTSSPALVLNTSRGQDQITNVPEPSTMTMVMVGIAWLFVGVRSRKSASVPGIAA